MQTSRIDPASDEYAAPGGGSTPAGYQAATPAVSFAPNTQGLSVVIELAMSEAVADCLRLFNPSGKEGNVLG